MANEACDMAKGLGFRLANGLLAYLMPALAGCGLWVRLTWAAAGSRSSARAEMWLWQLAALLSRPATSSYTIKLQPRLVQPQPARIQRKIAGNAQARQQQADTRQQQARARRQGTSRRRSVCCLSSSASLLSLEPDHISSSGSRPLERLDLSRAVSDEAADKAPCVTHSAAPSLPSIWASGANSCVSWRHLRRAI